ncbi:hypothetical protein ACFWPQ_10310 [Streptomyces sp. NPDC058464]|uniref:hypothetical protein n=1 Tax=Streptomyces sp. NPDC058464 TaxID=3346511 RepID=UPI003660558E
MAAAPGTVWTGSRSPGSEATTAAEQTRNTVAEAHPGDTPRTYRAEQVTDDTCRAPRSPAR